MGFASSRFNARAYIDLMNLDGRPVLRFFDEAIRFSATHLLPKISTYAVWDTTVLCWSSVYTGLLEIWCLMKNRSLGIYLRSWLLLTTAKWRRVELISLQSRHWRKVSLASKRRFPKFEAGPLENPKTDFVRSCYKVYDWHANTRRNYSICFCVRRFPSLRSFTRSEILHPTLAERAKIAL